jgi:hypothetical protein
MLMGNTERRTVYKNFELLNLHTDAHDFTHKNYERYLKNAHFIGPEETDYWARGYSNILPADPPPNDLPKGLFNVFPLDLTSESLKKNASVGSSLGKLSPPPPPPPPPIMVTLFSDALSLHVSGVVSTSPLKLEVEFSQVVQDFTWFLCYTYVYTNKVSYTGSKSKQDVQFSVL